MIDLASLSCKHASEEVVFLAEAMEMNLQKIVQAFEQGQGRGVIECIRFDGRIGFYCTGCGLLVTMPPTIC